jgi:hypothetical protein
MSNDEYRISKIRIAPDVLHQNGWKVLFTAKDAKVSKRVAKEK